MAANAVCVTLIFTFLSQYARSSDVFDNILDDVSPCVDVCEQTYPLHTYPKAEHLFACKRGCRMFSIMEFVEDSNDFNGTTIHCNAACQEAYTLPGNMYACNLGCQNQLPFAKKRVEELAGEPSPIHVLEPMLLVRHFYNNFLDNAKSYVSWSWSMYMESDNGKVYMFQSQPQIFTSGPWADGDNFLGSDKMLRDIETNLQALKNDDGEKGPSAAMMISDGDDSNDWLACVSKKSGLPRWVLSATIFLSSMALLWLCCATTVTAPDQRVRKEKLSIYGDLEYLNESKDKYPYPVYIKPASPDEDAEPLPMKIHIDNTQSKI
ncbi:transmembrane protein 59-like isoform X2 [Ptychodera flava]|uniref:transmembrane protein 59-like isoform X2 n=1 Tax=Ptychodera flava TaxID=63121 RepID=UPI00396A9E9E